MISKRNINNVSASRGESAYTSELKSAREGNDVIEMPEAFHTGSDDVPFADDWAGTPGIRLKLLMADIEGARFAVRIRFAPGILLPPHKHTGEVHAFTLAGEWSYLEHPNNPPSRAGSYLFEPPGSTHTLKVADHNQGDTDVVFIVYGAMIHLGSRGEVLAVGDAESHLRDWPAALRAQGKPVPTTLPIGGAMRYRAVPGLRTSVVPRAGRG